LEKVVEEKLHWLYRVFADVTDFKVARLEMYFKQ